MANNKTKFKKEDIGSHKTILVIINNNLHRLFAWNGVTQINFVVIINSNFNN